jgi:Zinc-finger domain of monoamine-oxidase A repressor R1
MTMSSVHHYNTQSPRSPMKSLNSQENIPIPSPKKSIQLGIEAFTKKRDIQNVDSNSNPQIKKLKSITGESITVTNGPERETVVCHQCKQHIQVPMSIQCTFVKKRGGMKRCTIRYCHRCLSKRYGEKTKDIKEKREMEEGHVREEGYTWSCPSCRGICNCSYCRKRKGLLPLGYGIWIKT